MPSEKTRIKNHHPRPESVDELMKWKRDVAGIAHQAEAALYEYIGPDSKRKKFFFDYILSHRQMKDVDKELPYACTLV